MICAPYLTLISVYMARTFEKVPGRKAFLEKMAAAERNADRQPEKLQRPTVKYQKSGYQAAGARQFFRK